MSPIESRIDPASAEFKANYSAMEALVVDLRHELQRAREERADKARARAAGLGKLSVQQRIDFVLDPNTPWLDLAPLAARGLYDGTIHGAGIRAGIGVVSGHEVLVVANDPTIKGGALFPLGVKKFLRCQTIAMENRLPILMLVDSGGAFLPLQSEVFPDHDGFGRVFCNQARMSKMNIPQVTAVMGHCTAGGAYLPAMSDHVVQVRSTGAIFLGGPPLVRAATGEEVTADELGGAEVHCRESGVSDYMAQDDAHACEVIRDIFALLPRERPPGPARDPRPPLFDPAELWGIIPARLSTPRDVRELLARILDASEMLEFKALYGSTLVTGFGHIHGYEVGVIGNNGVLVSESARKATQFIQLCDRQGIPLVFLQNVSGYMVGRDYERAGIIKDGQKMVNAVATSTVAKLTVVVGASFGAGNYGMCGRAYDPRFLWMWPNAQIGVMGGEQAAQVLATVKNEQRAREGHAPLDAAELEALRRPILESTAREGSAYHSTSHLWDDGILDPADTRDVLGLALALVQRSPRSDHGQGYGTFRM